MSFGKMVFEDETWQQTHLPPRCVLIDFNVGIFHFDADVTDDANVDTDGDVVPRLDLLETVRTSETVFVKRWSSRKLWPKYESLTNYLVIMTRCG
jgi:hypothetical protein